MEVVARAAILWAFLIIVLRAAGRKELSQMTSFELVMLIVLGDLIQQGVTGNDLSVTGAGLAVGTFVLLTLASSYLSFKFGPVRTVMESTPVILIRNGKVIEEVLRIERLTMDELKEVAREQGIDDLRNVRYAILEPDGKFSFLKAVDDDSPRPQEDRAH